MRYKKNNKPKLLLAIAALLVLFSVAIGVTYSWIEGGTTYFMETEDEQDIKLGKFDETYAGTIKLDPSEGNIALIDYDKTVGDYQDLYFTPVSSADGKNFFFPEKFNADGQPLSYSAATTNDIGTKFVNFSVDVEASKRCYLAFNGTPKIVVTKGGKEVTDTSAFRFMISSKAKATSHFFSTDTTGSVNGVTSVAGATSEFTLEKFTDYQNDSTTTKIRLFQYEMNEKDTLTISVWLDCLAENYSELCGCDVNIDAELIVSEPKSLIKFNAVTYDNEGELEDGFKGGTINSRTSAFDVYAVIGSTYKATAAPNDNYTFAGWFTNEACTGNAVETNPYSITVSAAESAYFAKFVEKLEYTITVGQKTEPSAVGGSVYIGEEGTTSLKLHADKTAEIKATPEPGYRFLGWYTNAACTGSSVSTSDSYTVTFNEGQPTAYYAKFAKEYTINFKTRTNGTVGGAGGYVNIGSAASTDTSKTVTSYHGATLKLYTKPNTGYNFNGIYKEGSSTALSTTEITVDGNATYYADYTIKTYTVTYKIYTNGEASTTGGQISFDGASWSSDDLTNNSITHGSEIAFHAKANDTYKLDKIYLSTNSSTTVTSGEKVTVTGDITYIANFIPESKPTTIYIEPRTGYSSYYAWVWDDDNNNYTGGTWPGAQASYDNETGYYKLVIDGPDTGNFKIIVSNNAGSQSSEKSGAFGGTYLFTSGNDSFFSFNPSSMKTVYVGVVEYQDDVANEDTLRLHWWSSSGTYKGNVDPTYIGDYSYSPGSNYWSGSKQKFYMYEVKVPAEAINMKAWADNSSDTWYGGDSVISNGNCLMLFEYDNTYHANQITYNP